MLQGHRYPGRRGHKFLWHLPWARSDAPSGRKTTNFMIHSQKVPKKGVAIFLVFSIMGCEMISFCFPPAMKNLAMKNLIVPFSLLFLCTLFVSGCDMSPPKIPVEEMPPVAPQGAAAQNGDAQNENGAEYVRAETGVGARGQGLTPPSANNPVGAMISAPVYSMFRTEQRIVFDLQIAPAMNIFRATHDRLPNSHDEFMREIIQANNIQLPRLPAGQEYVYDPQRGELMVRRPR